jgi:hypothetical protein
VTVSRLAPPPAVVAAAVGAGVVAGAAAAGAGHNARAVQDAPSARQASNWAKARRTRHIGVIGRRTGGGVN